MTLYIHGFGGCGEGLKSTALDKYFSDVISPDLPISPKEAIAFLEKRITPGTLLVGSSLGGFYTTYLATKHNLKAVLINPSTLPFHTLYSYVGTNKRHCDGSEFEVTKEHIEELKTFDVKKPGGNLLVLLQSADEVLDYRIAVEKYKEHRIILEYGGNHRFENIEDYFSMIERFRG